MTSSSKVRTTVAVEASLRSKVALGVFAVVLHVIANIFYFSKYGFPASPGGNIWFLECVAYGYHHLVISDPLHWVLPLMGFLGPSVLFVVLVLISNLVHFLSLWLLFIALKEFHLDERAALWGCAIFTSLNVGLVFTTGSFPQQQASLPLVIAILLLGDRMVRTKDLRRRKILATILLIIFIIGASMGPDVLVVSTLAIPCIIFWQIRRRFSSISFIRALMGTLFLALFLGALVVARPYLDDLRNILAAHLRGVDLVAQRNVHAANVMPMSWMDLWSRYSYLSGIVLAMAGGVWMRGRLPELALLSLSILCSMFQVRFAFFLDLSVVVLTSWVLARGLTDWPRLQSYAGPILFTLFLGHSLWVGVPCAYPGTVTAALDELRLDPTPDKKVLCTPTYGYLVRAYTGAEPTSDFHNVDSGWMELASSPAETTLPFLRKMGVTHILFTSADFNEGVMGDAHGNLVPNTVASGGLDFYIKRLSSEEVSHSLIKRVLYDSEPLPDTKIMSAQGNAAQGHRVILLRIESGSSKTAIPAEVPKEPVENPAVK